MGVVGGMIVGIVLRVGVRVVLVVVVVVVVAVGGSSIGGLVVVVVVVVVCLYPSPPSVPILSLNNVLVYLSYRMLGLHSTSLILEVACNRF